MYRGDNRWGDRWPQPFGRAFGVDPIRRDHRERLSGARAAPFSANTIRRDHRGRASGARAAPFGASPLANRPLTETVGKDCRALGNHPLVHPLRRNGHDNMYE